MTSPATRRDLEQAYFHGLRHMGDIDPIVAKEDLGYDTNPQEFEASITPYIPDTPETAPHDPQTAENPAVTQLVGQYATAKYPSEVKHPGYDAYRLAREGQLKSPDEVDEIAAAAQQRMNELKP